MESYSKIDKDNKVKIVKVLARAACEPEYYKKLHDNTSRTLIEEGIKGKEFYVPDEKDLKSIFGLLETLESERKKTRN